MLNVLNKYGPPKPEYLGIDKIAIELTGDPNQLLLKLKNHPASNVTSATPQPFSLPPEFFSLPCTYLLPEPRAETTEKLPYPFVIQPANLDAVFNRRVITKAAS